VRSLNIVTRFIRNCIAFNMNENFFSPYVVGYAEAEWYGAGLAT